MKTLLLVFGHAGIDDMIARHSDSWMASNADEVVGVGRVGESIAWPNWMPTFDIGKQGHVDTGQLPERLIETLRYVTVMADYAKFDDIIISEADTYFFGALKPRRGDFESNPFINEDPRFKSALYYHPYWRFSREMALKVVAMGTKLLVEGEREHGFPDRFLGLVMERIGVTCAAGPTFSCNSFDEPRYIEAGRTAIASGSIFLHGIKTQAQLEALI